MSTVTSTETRSEERLPIHSTGVWADNNGVYEVHVTEIRHTHRATVQVVHRHTGTEKSLGEAFRVSTRCRRIARTHRFRHSEGGRR